MPAPKKKPAADSGANLDVTVNDSGLLQAFRSQIGRGGEAGKAPAQRAQSEREAQEAIQKMNGPQRAARLMLALGAEQAALILKELEAAEIEKVMTEMSRIEAITADERKAILSFFDEQSQDFDAPTRGGVDQARKILEMGLGQEAANEIIGRLTRQDLYQDFLFLENIDPPVLAHTLAQEHVQVSAVALSFLKPKISAAVLRCLPDSVRAEVAVRIAKTARIHPDAVQRVARVLREKFEKRQSEVYSEVGGADTLANILNHMDRGHEDSILDSVGRDAPDLLEDVKEKLYVFEELANLDYKEMRMLIARINDDILVAAALRGAPEDVRRAFFNSMSQNRAADVIEEMDRRGPLSIKEINEARQYLLSIARRMDEEGDIVIKKEKEEYI